METIKSNFKMKAIKTYCVLLLFSIFLLQGVYGQVIMDSQNKVDVILDDGTQVILYGKAKTRSNEFSSEYVYLPTNLHLSKRPDGTPEFLFLKYTTDETEDAGGAQGGL